jgi:predicted phage terminase large subunit-like protein
VRRASANNWFSQTAITRLNDKRFGRIVIVMQRLHQDDMTGYVLAQGGWSHVSLSAIALHDEVYSIGTPFGVLRHSRREGEALHPIREPLEELHKLRASMGTGFFAGQYLQEPSPPGGTIIKSAWFRRYVSQDLVGQFDHIIQSWDIGQKADQIHDPSVCTTWGIKGSDAYLMHVLRVRQEYPDLKRTVIAMQLEYGANHVLIEDKVSGTGLIQDLRRDGLWQAKGVVPKGDKIHRIQLHSARIESGKVWLPQAAPWLPDYLHELEMFPKGRHDDQVDSTSQALQFVAERFDKPAALVVIERQVASYRTNETKDQTIVRVKGPHGAMILTRDGTRYMAGTDGIIRLPLPDAVPYFRQPGWSRVDCE